VGVTYDGATVAVVVPTCNESGPIGGVIETIPSCVDRVCSVEGSPTDGTWTEIRATARRVNAETEPDAEFACRVVPLRHEENWGGGVIKTGYPAARDGRIDVAAVMGGDAQMRPELLAGVIALVIVTWFHSHSTSSRRTSYPSYRYRGRCYDDRIGVGRCQCCLDNPEHALDNLVVLGAPVKHRVSLLELQEAGVKLVDERGEGIAASADVGRYRR
jgi:hypothetical protein